MNCRELQEKMYEVAFGESERTPAFEHHLLSCGDCKKAFAAASFAAQGIADAPPPPAPSLSNDRLRTAILSSNLRSRPTWIPRLSFAGAAAALAFAAWMGFAQRVDEPRPRDIVAIREVDPNRSSESSVQPVTPEKTPETVTPVKAIESPVERPTRPNRRHSSRPRTEVASNDVESQVPDD